jgi:hypothetical protein
MMNPGPPKTNKTPVKPILLTVLGAAIVIWISHSSFNRQAPRSSRNDSKSNSISPNGSSSVSDQQNEHVARYPELTSQERMSPEKEYPVEVSLTEKQEDTDVIIQKGPTTSEGKLVFDLPATQADSWKLDVDLFAPGMIFTDGGTGSGSIELPRHGDATSAIFHVKAGPKAIASGVVHMFAVFSYNHSPLAKIGRDIQITRDSTPELTSQAVMSKTTAEVGSSIPATPLNERVPPPDMTVIISGNSVLAESAFYRMRGELGEMEKFSDFIAERSPANAGRGTELVAKEKTWRGAETFGDQLYDNYAPLAFKEVFWATDRRLGKKFRTIQIYSDRPEIPWELMRPATDAKGTDRRDFLGLDYSVARWDSNDKLLSEHPPYEQTMTKMFVIAPHYGGSLSLDGQAAETQQLALMDGYNAVGGNTTALKTLFQNPPQGIVHFAGHGELDAAHKEYEILLEDGTLDTSTWRSMTPPNRLAHTFFFFNACDVGQSTQIGNFVDGFGPAVISRGASGYIGALWPVNDKVAANFSVVFYGLMHDEMRSGSANISEILERTRQTVYGKTRNPTALAYVLYGDTALNFVK